MGWARYAQTMRVFVMNSGLFYTRPSARTVSLMDKITGRLERAKVGRCRLTVSKPVLKAPTVLALETKIR